LLGLRIGNDVDKLATPAGAELNLAGSRREQRVIAATADIDARVELGPPLTHDYRSRSDFGPIENLDA
jgi:hypothetical protein